MFVSGTLRALNQFDRLPTLTGETRKHMKSDCNEIQHLQSLAACISITRWHTCFPDFATLFQLWIVILDELALQRPQCQSRRSQHKCAGVGDSDAIAHICYECATCLCVSDKLIKMPRFALANCMWLGRQHPLLQNASLGLNLLLGLGRPCFRKLLLGGGRREDRQFGTTGQPRL